MANQTKPKRISHAQLGKLAESSEIVGKVYSPIAQEAKRDRDYLTEMAKYMRKVLSDRSLRELFSRCPQEYLMQLAEYVGDGGTESTFISLEVNNLDSYFHIFSKFSPSIGNQVRKGGTVYKIRCYDLSPRTNIMARRAILELSEYNGEIVGHRAGQKFGDEITRNAFSENYYGNFNTEVLNYSLEMRVKDIIEEIAP